MSLQINIDWNPTSGTATRVILMRHGQSTYNAEKRHQGSSDDAVLTAKGRVTAYQTGLLLRQLAIQAVYVSPLQRTQETAAEVMSAIATDTDRLPDIIPHSGLKEISLPLWEGLPYQVVRSEFAEDYRRWKAQPDQFQMQVQRISAQTGSVTLANLARYPVRELYDRTQQFWQQILPRHRGETLLVVSHAGTNRALISTALGIAPSRFHLLQQSNCGISVLQFPNADPQLPHLAALNSTDHLREVLPKLKEGKQGLRLLVVAASGANHDRIQALAARLATVTIDFSITNDLNDSQATLNQLLQHHPNTVQLQVLREDFPQAWQQILTSRHLQTRSPEPQDQPLTALVVVRTAIALRLLSQLLEIHPQSLHLIPDTLSVIHYPQLQTPVLQALNIA